VEVVEPLLEVVRTLAEAAQLWDEAAQPLVGVEWPSEEVRRPLVEALQLLVKAAVQGSIGTCNRTGMPAEGQDGRWEGKVETSLKGPALGEGKGMLLAGKLGPNLLRIRMPLAQAPQCTWKCAHCLGCLCSQLWVHQGSR
jgi:hypothetical protein